MKLVEKERHFPFSLDKFKAYLKNKHDMLLANQFRSQTGEKVGFLSFYDDKVEFHTICQIRKSGKLQELVGLELHAHKGLSYKAIDNFFQRS